MIEEKNIGEVSVEDTQITFSDKNGEHIYKTGTMNDPDLVNRLEAAGAVFSKPIVQQMGMLEYMLLAIFFQLRCLLFWDGFFPENDEQDGRWREHDDLWHGRRFKEQCQSLCKIPLMVLNLKMLPERRKPKNFFRRSLISFIIRKSIARSVQKCQKVRFL